MFKIFSVTLQPNFAIVVYFLRYNNKIKVDMKKITLLLTALFFSMISFAAKATVTVTAGNNATYTEGEVLKVAGLSITELGINGEVSLTVYGWDGVGGAAAGYAGTAEYLGEELGFCDDGLMITKDASGKLTMSGIMYGYPNNLQIDVQVNPKKASTIVLTSDKMTAVPSSQEPRDLVLSVLDSGYSVEVLLFDGMIKGFGTYAEDALLATINGVSATLMEKTVATYSAAENLVQLEATFLQGVDTFLVRFTGFPYAKPEDIVPVDTVELYFANASVRYASGMNRIEATSMDPQAELFIGYMGTMFTTINASNFSYSTSLVIDGEDITFLRGEMTVQKDGDDKVMTAGLLGDNRMWYNIHLTTAATITTATENIPVQTAAKKIIENGQLWIVKDGVKYNVLGSF